MSVIYSDEPTSVGLVTTNSFCRVSLIVNWRFFSTQSTRRRPPWPLTFGPGVSSLFSFFNLMISQSKCWAQSWWSLLPASLCSRNCVLIIIITIITLRADSVDHVVTDSSGPGPFFFFFCYWNPVFVDNIIRDVCDWTTLILRFCLKETKHQRTEAINGINKKKKGHLINRNTHYCY